MSVYDDMGDYLAITEREHGDLYAGLDGDCPRCRGCDEPLGEDEGDECDRCAGARLEQLAIDERRDERGP